MDLKYLLNPLPEPPPPPAPQDQSQIGNNNTSQNASRSNDLLHHGDLPPHSQSQLYPHSRFLFSPRKLDPETASVSTTSSTKRRRTNRSNRIDLDNPSRSTTARNNGNPISMSRTFSELQVPSDTSSSLSDEQSVKRAVAQLSLSGFLLSLDSMLMLM